MVSTKVPTSKFFQLSFIDLQPHRDSFLKKKKKVRGLETPPAI